MAENPTKTLVKGDHLIEWCLGPGFAIFPYNFYWCRIYFWAPEHNKIGGFGSMFLLLQGFFFRFQPFVFRGLEGIHGQHRDFCSHFDNVGFASQMRDLRLGVDVIDANETPNLETAF